MMFAPDCGEDVIRSGLLRIGRLDFGAWEELTGRTFGVDEKANSGSDADAGEEDDRMTDAGLLRVPICWGKGFQLLICILWQTVLRLCLNEWG